MHIYKSVLSSGEEKVHVVYDLDIGPLCGIDAVVLIGWRSV